jgi:hypothetical protein
MATAIMGIPPEETQAFKTDIEYRLSVADAMNEVLDREGIDEVILTYSVDGDQSDGESTDLGEEGFDFAMNPGTVADFLRGQGVGEDLIFYVMSFSDNQVHGKLANAIRKAPKELGHAMTLVELKQIGEPLRPKELTPLELALYEVVKEEKNLTAWLGREIRLIKKEYGDKIENTDIVQFLYPLQSIKDWYIDTGRPSGMQHLSFKDAHEKAVEWERAQAGKGAGMYYGPVKPENILYLDPKTGFSVQVVDNLNDLTVEGHKMHHCVGRYWEDCEFSAYGGDVKSGTTKIVSLRDPTNIPHVTVEFGDALRGKGPAPDWRVHQIKGIQNSVPDSQFRIILARYLVTIPGLQYVNRNQSHSRVLGFRSLAIDSAVGANRWPYESSTEKFHGRPNDLTEEETAAIIVDHAKNITAALQHTKRYSWKAKKGDDGFRFDDRKVGLDIRTQSPDEYGIMMVTEKREETKLNAAIFSGDLRVYIGDVWLDKNQDVPLTPVLKQAIDIYIDVIIQVDKIEHKLHDQWKKAVGDTLKKKKAILAELKKIGPENLSAEHFKKGLLEGFLKEQNRSENMPMPSYANQLNLVERDIVRAQSALDDRRYWESVSAKMVSAAPFSYDSFSDAAKKMITRPEDYEGYPHGRWHLSNALQYYALTLFEKINGDPIFADEE